MAGIGAAPDITYNIPEIWSNKYPDRITVTRQYATPGLIEEIEQNATGKLDSNNMSEDYFSMDADPARMAAYIFSKISSGFTGGTFLRGGGWL